MAFDKDLRNLIVATPKASPPIGDALERQREKLRMKRKMSEGTEAKSAPPTNSDEPEL
jgi:hypothetical protein